jgi:acyl dehydratase
MPDGAPQLACDLPTLPQAALIYRLSGDYNILHSDPAHAQKVGFPRPILHGLCTFGVAGHALLKTLCGYDTTRFKSMEARFSSPVYPGETLCTEMWKNGNVVSFRCTVPARENVVVLNNGRAEIV